MTSAERGPIQQETVTGCLFMKDISTSTLAFGRDVLNNLNPPFDLKKISWNVRYLLMVYTTILVICYLFRYH